MLFHHRVQGHLPMQRPDGYDGDWPPASATGCAGQSSVINTFREAWRGILAVDYRPVFETGRAALAELTADPDTGQAMRSLAEVVARVSERVTGLRHDLLGRIFHRVLDTARYDGSFYPELPISSCLDPSNAPSSTRAIVVSLTDAVNHPIKLTKPSLGVVS